MCYRIEQSPFPMGLFLLWFDTNRFKNQALEDRAEVIGNKLKIEDRFLSNFGILTSSSDISCLPVLAMLATHLK